jgi:hypothetical protein
MSTSRKSLGRTHNEEIGYDGLGEVDRSFHDTQHGGHIGEIKIRALARLALLVGEEETNSIQDLMLRGEKSSMEVR